ncbi:hypothetical protein OCK74_17565 [Chitinophagaceae bacterium LB-8]|uniref:Outer membrane protein beta-barrel domain-containing protein n=1 Tax=Paraflavisolibacter caeni TaxID=2982496 RepID=A0A9X2XPC1_9BACT|nr:hypothetical protein [Paraflavisolibacter caeni]MCU7550933.1 hypothetical protein [Paraflavisolibacter caeni]
MQKVVGIFIFILFMLYSNALQAQMNIPAQKEEKPRTFYIAIGTNRSFYSKSDIRLKSSAHPAFDFTLENVRGKDDEGLDFSQGAPQYSYALGYYNYKKNWGIEFNFDHIKYYILQSQPVRMQGTINGHNYETDTLINPDFVQLEHSDGANYALLKWMKWKPLLQDKNGVKVLNLLFKAGAGPVIPKTNTTIMGKHRDDRYNITGYVIVLEGGLRYNISKLLFAEANAKGAFANYSHFLIADGWGSQQWFGLHMALLIGVQISSK